MKGTNTKKMVYYTGNYDSMAAYSWSGSQDCSRSGNSALLHFTFLLKNGRLC